MDRELDVLALDRLCAAWQHEPPPLPNVIGIGSSRAGTSSVYSYLRSHPDVFVPAVKELNYFGYRTIQALGRERGLPIELYRMYFSGYRGQRAIGEISPIYLSQSGAANQIHAYLGAACKIIAFIRPPVERFLSQFVSFAPHLHGIGVEEYTAAALDRYGEGSHASSWDAPDRALRSSLYSADLKRFIDRFGRDQVLVIEFSQLRAPDRLATTLCAFLGVADPGVPVPHTNATAHSATPSAATMRRLHTFFRRDIAQTAAVTGLDLSYWTAG